jgi:predicted transcriptional regulator
MTDKAKDLMRRGAITCNEDMSVRSVAQIMVVNRLRYTVVINKQCELKGIISADSILRAYDKDIDSLRAKDILETYTFTTTPATPLQEAIALMKKRKIEHLIVVGDPPRDRSVLGILHASDIVRSMAQRVKGEGI